MIFICNINIDVDSCRLKDLSNNFLKAMRKIFEQFVSQAIYKFGDLYKKDGRLADMLGCGKNDLIWKSKPGNKKTNILTPFGWIRLPQMQVQNKKTRKKIFITRVLLGLKKYKRIAMFLKKRFGFIGAMSSFRPTVKIIELLTGVKTNIMTIWRSVKDFASKIKFEIDPNETNEFEADGTGIPVPSAGVLGSEAKVFTQRKKGGGIRIAGLGIAKYKQGWDKIIGGLKKFANAVLVTDGDKDISKSLKNTLVTIQTCLWHVLHGLKSMLWVDGLSLKKDGEYFSYIFYELKDIVNTKVFKNKTLTQRQEIISEKNKKLDGLICECKMAGHKKTASYLQNLKPCLFTAVGKIKSYTTSLTERVMRNINQRINIGTWSDSGSLDVMKIRLAYYYNGLEIE
jgi:hypothetical protein